MLGYDEGDHVFKGYLRNMYIFPVIMVPCCLAGLASLCQHGMETFLHIINM